MSQSKARQRGRERGTPLRLVEAVDRSNRRAFGRSTFDEAKREKRVWASDKATNEGQLWTDGWPERPLTRTEW